uniref:Rieske domain-containing protein n=1 Tax=Peronospora matthiolae TaxID=2874970 RepID=A0AAV1UF77_9STRA
MIDGSRRLSSWMEEEVVTETSVRRYWNRHDHGDSCYLWFKTHVRSSDVVEATEHRRQYEYSVNGRKRVKPGSAITTLGTKVDVNGRTVAIFKYKGGLYAIQNACPHQAASLHLGDIEDIDGTPCISCPRHKWPYSLEDGLCLLPVDCRAECYPICVRQERDGSEIVYVGFTAISDSLFHDDSF